MTIETEPKSAKPVNPIEEKKKTPLTFQKVRGGLYVALAGFVIFLVGAQPSLFGLDRSPVVGFIQIAVMLVGIAVICLGGYINVKSFWQGQPVSIAADIGMRLVASGYVVALFSGMADVFGIGSHPLPGVPYFGVWQARGMEIGLAVIAIGLILMMPFAARETGHIKRH